MAFDFSLIGFYFEIVNRKRVVSPPLPLCSAAKLATGATPEFDVALCSSQRLLGGEDSAQPSGKSRCDIMLRNKKEKNPHKRTHFVCPMRVSLTAQSDALLENFGEIYAKPSRWGVFCFFFYTLHQYVMEESPCI